MLAVILAAAAVLLIIASAFIYLKMRYRYWKSLGITGPEPTLLLGNMTDIYSFRTTEVSTMDSWYQEFKNEPFIGYYNLWKPTLFVMDPQLIKTFNEVHFDHFSSRPPVCGCFDSDAIMDSLISMSGIQWKLKRQIFSTLFPPKNLKEYCEIMNHYGSTLLTEIDEHSELCEPIPLEHIAKRHMIRSMSNIFYSLDVSQNEEVFSKLSDLAEVFKYPPSATKLKFYIYTVAPRLFKFLGITTYSQEFWNFFSSFTEDLVQSRDQAKIGRDDLVSLVAKLQKDGSFGSGRIDHGESVGHMFFFFMASIHSTVSTLHHVLFQLSRNPEVQKKLRDEVGNVLSENEYVSYESITKIKYLQCVINESLRMFPQGGLISTEGILKRTCTIPFKINEKFTIPKDMDVIFPVFSLHMDPQYFSRPEEFIPERFSDLETLPPAYMPFGKGPRTCLGKRLAYVSLMVSLAKIISNYTILPWADEECPIKHDPRTVTLTYRPLDNLKLKLQKRELTCSSSQ